MTPPRAWRRGVGSNAGDLPTGPRAVRSPAPSAASAGRGGSRAALAVAIALTACDRGRAEWAQPPEPMRVRHPAMPTGLPADGTDGHAVDVDGQFSVPDGFRVERLFVVPPADLGSWVCLATDAAGRILASDQGEKGLVRITPAALDGATPTVVERIPAPISGAQGMLWAFDSLYVVRNGGTESGLYRVTDSDRDGMLDQVTLLRSFVGEGEHGPHAVRLSPDGARLFVIAGNHTKPPFPVEDLTPPQPLGGIRTSQRRVRLPDDAASRLPANWDEDQIIPRLWDANGHAVGILAPGGWIASTDRDGTNWELWAAGFRNAYDFAFNADGDLFVADSDMEWDFGTPWYRPTRILHATSGGDFGWRSGSGKWPASFPDSMPACVDLGPGSPTGVTFGTGARFPARYQRALFACDWTFGTLYAVHLEPAGASYVGRREPFLTRSPLPLTDAVVGADGALYLAVGGRGARSELYRVTYAGTEPTGPAGAPSGDRHADRSLRRSLEAGHRRAADPAAAVSAALPHLGSPDRFIRHAARTVLEHQPLEVWQDAALASPQPRARIAAAIATARQAEPAAREAVLRALDSVDTAALEADARIDLARAYELAVVRLGDPGAVVRSRIAARLAPWFPSGVFDLDRELASLLVGLRADGIVSRLGGLLAAPSAGRPAFGIADDELRRVIGRNEAYGGAIRAALENHADLLQVHFAYVLRTARHPGMWPDSDRLAYHRWFGRARTWAGGESFRKFLAAIEAESLAGLAPEERLGLESQGVVAPWSPPPLPKPVGPGRSWTVADVLAAADADLDAGRDFAAGKRAFAAARCGVCHRYGTDGGSTGPDLTQAGGRFSVGDLVEAIVHPSAAVSDQYRASVVQTTDGRVVTGRIVAASVDGLTVAADPEDGRRVVEIPAAEVAAVTASPTSPMPAGLLDPLNRDEVLDLVAYVLARDDENHRRFQPR